MHKQRVQHVSKDQNRQISAINDNNVSKGGGVVKKVFSTTGIHLQDR